MVLHRFFNEEKVVAGVHDKLVAGSSELDYEV
jgi:hypothetical protein